MAFSYSFHISTKSHSVSNSNKVSQVGKHNLRLYKSTSFDKNNIDVLVGSSNNLLDNIRQIYDNEFSAALEKYNQGKRVDRQINDYLDHVSKSRNDVAVEIIIQVGDMEFWKDKSLKDKKVMNYIFKDQIKVLESVCPDFKVASAVVHYDEKSPHMHVVGVPVAKGYKKGLSVQCAKTKVFTKDTLIMLQEKMRARAEVGISLNPNVFNDMHLKDKSNGRNKDIPKRSLNQFYDLEKKTDNLKKELDEIELSLKSKKAEMTKIQSLIDNLKQLYNKWSKKVENLKLEYKKIEETPPQVTIQNIDYKKANENTLNAFSDLAEWVIKKYDCEKELRMNLIDNKNFNNIWKLRKKSKKENQSKKNKSIKL